MYVKFRNTTTKICIIKMNYICRIWLKRENGLLENKGTWKYFP